MARAGLGLTINDLAKLAGVRTMTISAYEGGKAKTQPATVEALRAALVREGVEFINGGKRLGVAVPRRD